MAVTYVVDGIGAGGNFASLNDACTEFETYHDYSVDGMAYISIEHSGEETNVVTLGDPVEDTTETSSAYLEISVHPDHRHQGVWSNSKWRLTTSGASHNITISDIDSSHWIGLQVKSTSSTNSQETARAANNYSYDNLFEKSIFWHDGSGGDHDCIYVGAVAATALAFDCVFIMNSSGRACIHLQNYQGSASPEIEFEHCTGYSVGGAYVFGGTTASNSPILGAWNSIAAGSATNDYDKNTGSGTLPTFTINGCCSEDTSITGEKTAGANNTESVEWSDTDTAGKEIWMEDLTTEPFDFQIKTGTNTSNTATGHAVTGSGFQIGTDWAYSRVDTTKDVAGNDRPATWGDRDAGAYEIAGAAGVSIPAAMNSYRQRNQISMG